MTATRSVFVGLFCLSAAVLILEITLTRIFSVLIWGNYGFLVISTALLGFGAAGTFLAFFRRKMLKNLDQVLPLLMISSGMYRL